MSKTTISRRPTTSAILSTEKVALDTPTQDVDHSLVRSSGIALPDPQGIENEANTPKVNKALEDERFFSEKVTVMLTEPATEWEQQYCEVTVNGDHLCLPRNGLEVDVKRYHLAVIAGAKQQRLIQKKITLPDGSMGYEERAVLQPVYPFQVIHDANPRGVTWLRQLMQRS